MSETQFATAVETYRHALNEFLKGDPSSVLALFSRRDDVTLANPLGPARRGRAGVEEAAKAAAAHFKGGSSTFDEVSRHVTPELGYVLHVERADVQMQDSDDTKRISLRVTTIFRPEEGAWKIVHRHADPITAPRDITTIFDSS